MAHISSDVFILSARDLEEREHKAFKRGVERGKFEEGMRRGEARVAINCANWKDGYCEMCGAQTQNMAISAEYACPSFVRR
jgi:hypothetical protein